MSDNAPCDHAVVEWRATTNWWHCTACGTRFRVVPGYGHVAEEEVHAH